MRAIFDLVAIFRVAGSQDLADTFASVARALEAASDPTETRHVVTRTAVEIVPGCDHASISLIARRGGVTTVAATDEVVRRVDAIQYRLGEGPALDAIADHAVYAIDDLAQASRLWPRFVAKAAKEIGVASMLCFRLYTADDTAGALNLYARRPHAFTDESRAVGAILAAHAAVALLAAGQHENVENLETALASSREIGTAVGVVMMRRNVTRDEAFGFLVDASQRLNHKLRDLAEVIIEDPGVIDRLGARVRQR